MKAPSLIKHPLRGFSLVEALLSSAIFTLVALGFLTTYLYGQESNGLAGGRIRAVLLANEGLEALRNIRDNNFSNLSAGTFGLATSSNEWTLNGTSDTKDGFTRSLTLQARDSHSFWATSTVVWQQNAQRTGQVTLTTVLADWQRQLSTGNWANAATTSLTDLSGNNNALKVATAGDYAYLVRSDTSSNFIVMDITSLDAPVLLTTISVSGTPSNIFISGNYAYVTTDSNSQELQIVDISTPSSPSVVGSYNAPGNSNANGVFVVGTKAYIVRSSSASDEFIIVDVTNPSSPTQLGTLDLAATGYEVVVSGNYAYVASGNNSQEVQIINILLPSAPFLSGPGVDLSGNSDADTIAMTGSTLLLGRGGNFYTIDVSNPLLPSVLGTLSLSGNATDIALDLSGNYVFLSSQSNIAEFQVVDISTLTAPVLLSSVDLAGNDNLNGVAYHTGKDRVYVVGDDNNQEFVVIAPQ